MDLSLQQTSSTSSRPGAGGKVNPASDYSVTTTGGNFRITRNTVIVDAGDNPNNNTKKR